MIAKLEMTLNKQTMSAINNYQQQQNHRLRTDIIIEKIGSQFTIHIQMPKRLTGELLFVLGYRAVLQMCLIGRNQVNGVFDQVELIPVCSAEYFNGTSLTTTLSRWYNKGAGQQSQVYSGRGPTYST